MLFPERTRRPLVCLVTAGPDRRSVADIVVEASDAGVDLIQIREPSLDDRTLMSLMRRVVASTHSTASRIIVNDRFDVAAAAGAAGVHLRGSSYPAARLRSVAPDPFLIGRSIHSSADVRDADGCDYLMFGTVFPSASKPAGHHAAGVDALRQVCARASMPVIAIGGISLENARQVIDAGACGVAAIGLFRGAASMSATMAALRRRIDT